DLHDDLCQELAGLAIGIGDLKDQRGDIQHTIAQDALSALQRRTSGLVEGVRRLSHDLHPTTLRHTGIAAALEGLCIEIEQRYDVQVSFARAVYHTDISPSAALCMFRVAQEALQNAAVHGNARRIAVSITKYEKDV